ncbi:uncharacterized protein MYCFIDRAFT_210381 [Pseudocercospora fijiensis CIRAD86]|uniref:Uncharacterized protein n=1 Tax=Pseudocercospora fijiensis (strain CIRAD86) TaxID=383855 RepID=M3A4E8_PSEFD|nr:uncharacterized protein MYCFIDRAFT_210381 [Pseudocercospora fijiensis CIRAD86]EME85994.1 hypothetical protein MYCFIDRAFT_210381 [Pseudocercospora fijiensis CIRAD86]
MRFPVMFNAQTVEIADTYCEHAGPKTVESWYSEELARGWGDVHRFVPTGGYRIASLVHS